MEEMCVRFWGVVLGAVFCLASTAFAQPAVVATAEGQLGETPGAGDKVIGARFESIRGAPGDTLLGGLFVFGGAMPPPPEFAFLTDRIHEDPDALPINSTPALFANVFKLPPASARARNAAGDGDFVAFSFAIDGAMPQTMTVRIATYDETGSSLVQVPITEIPTFPDPFFNDTGVAVDNQGRVTVAYTEIVPPSAFDVKAQRLDAITGLPIGGEIPITGNGRGDVDIALLDPAGNRLIIPITDLNTVSIRGHILDTTGPTPVVLPEFPISTTPGLININPAVAADPATGKALVVWENFVDIPGDPVNIRGRRFDAMGNPLGNDFIVNTTTANAQGQPAVAFGPGGESAVVWAGDGTPGDELDVFTQVYDAMGNPIGGEIRVNTATDDIQDKPTVRFLPEPDAQGQPQFVVAWRDVDGTDIPRGTGTSYKCFSIGEDPTAIFADGFESGDTSSWSDDQP